jgi:hypothetical protein
MAHHIKKQEVLYTVFCCLRYIVVYYARVYVAPRDQFTETKMRGFLLLFSSSQASSRSFCGGRKAAPKMNQTEPTTYYSCAFSDCGCLCWLPLWRRLPAHVTKSNSKLTNRKRNWQTTKLISSPQFMHF